MIVTATAPITLGVHRRNIPKTCAMLVTAGDYVAFTVYKHEKQLLTLMQELSMDFCRIRWDIYVNMKVSYPVRGNQQ